MSLFITGTDTGVGKTHTVAQLLRLLRAAGKSCAGFKPICCGDRRDAELLLAGSCEGLTIDEINPLWLKTPAAPLAAAALENIRVEPKSLLAAFAALRERVDHVFVEGVGGWMVPISENYYVSDLAAAMNLPVLVVAQNRLGCLNHTILTVQSVQKIGLECAAVVLNEMDGKSDVAVSTNREMLQGLLSVPILAGLTETTALLPPDWSRALGSVGKPESGR